MNNKMDLSFIHLSQSGWNKILSQVRNAMVFIDAKAAECLHWSIGTENLLVEGALAVQEFNAYKYFQTGATNVTEKAVFVTASSYASVQVDLCDILSQSSFTSVVLVTMPLHEPSAVLPKLRKDLLQWMSIKNGHIEALTAEVFNFPFFYAPITESVFLLPPFRDVFPPLDLNKVKSFGNKVETIATKDQVIAQQVALFLDSLFSQISASDVVFSVGAFSNSVAAALEDFPSVHHRRKVAQHRLSVVIVDRTLDLCAPASMESKCFLDKVLYTLPHLPDHTIDVAVNMSQLAQVTVDSMQDESLFPGCLSHQESVCRNTMEWLIHKKDRDILLYLHEILRTKLSPASKFATRVKPEALEKDVRQFRGNIEKIQQNCGILQMALAVVQSLTGEHAEELELVLSTERILRQNIATSPDVSELSGLLPQITKLLAERHIRGLTIDSLLTLLLLLYSLIGTDLNFPVKDEVQLQAAISTALFEDQEYPGLVHDILLPMDASKDKVNAIATHIFAVLKAVSHTRRDLSKYRSIIKGQGQAMPAEYIPFLQRIMRDILDPSKPHIPDLVSKSTGLRDLLKSGFSMLLNKQQATVTQHPSDNPNLMVLVLGGLTGGEIRFMQEAWNTSAHGKAGGVLLLAGSRLLSPNDTLQSVLKASSQTL